MIDKANAASFAPSYIFIDGNRFRKQILKKNVNLSARKLSSPLIFLHCYFPISPSDPEFLENN